MGQVQVIGLPIMLVCIVFPRRKGVTQNPQIPDHPPEKQQMIKLVMCVPSICPCVSP